MPNKNKVFKQLSTVLVARDLVGGGTTTLAAAVAAGAQVLSTVANTNFAIGDAIRVGSGSDLELAVIGPGAITGAGPYSVPLVAPLAKAHILGEAVVEQAMLDVGDITDAGAGVSVTSETVDVPVSTRRLLLTRLNGYSDLGADFAMPSITLEHIAFALGIPMTAVSGGGATFSDPIHLTTDGNEWASEQNNSLVILGVTMDGSIMRAELWGVDPDYTGLSFPLRRGALAAVPVRYIAGGGGVLDGNANPYTMVTTYRGSKSKVHEGLSEVGTIEDATVGPLATTSTGTAAAGQKIINLTAVTNLVAGDWLRIGTGDTVEYHRIATGGIAALVVTLATKLYRAIPAGTVVVRSILTPFATISTDGVTLAFGGSIDRIREGTQRMSIGVRPGNARVTATMAFLDFVLATLARGLGIPASAIANNRLPIQNSIGSAELNGLYVKGVLKDGTQAWVVLWGNTVDVSGFAARFGGTGTPTIPFGVIPSSAIQFQQHA